MAILDQPMGKLAKSLIGKFGRSATLKRSSTAYYDASVGKNRATSPTDVSCTVVITEFEQREVDGSLVKAGDRKGLVSASALGNVEPVANRDTLVEGGRTWQIVRFIGYSSGAQEAAYELHLRR